MTKLLLASSSSYRRALLTQLQLPFESATPGIDETPLPGEKAPALVERLSRQKAEALRDAFPDHIIIGSDQVASLGEALLTKPGEHGRALDQLMACSGRRTLFYTGLYICHADSGRQAQHTAVTEVQFRVLTPARIQRYLERERPYDCAGSFKCEGLGISLFESIRSDDPTALVGLPLIALSRLLSHFGLDPLD